MPISTGDLLGPDALDYPTNHAKSLEAKAAGGLVIAAHGLVGSVAPEIALGSVDSVDELKPFDYYRLLDSGIRLPITAGSDHPRDLVGTPRCYVKVGGPLDYAGWIDGTRRGQTFVTSGPLLELTVNGKDIGEEVLADTGEWLHIRAKAWSRNPIGRLHVHTDFETVAEVITQEHEAELDLMWPADRSRWIVARCTRDQGYLPYGRPDVAHTSAVYVIVDGERIFDVESALSLEQTCLVRLGQLVNFGTFETAEQLEEAVEVFEDGAQTYVDLQYYPDFSATPRQGNAPLTVSFTDESTNSPTLYAWDFENDGVIDSTLSGPVHTYEVPGLYDVRLDTPGAIGDTGDLKKEYVQVDGLWSDVEAISLSAGGPVCFTLSAGPPHAGMVFLLLGSLSGTSPGLDVDTVHLPLEPDAYLNATLYVQGLIAGSPGVLDDQGSAQAVLIVPPGAAPQLSGSEVHHANLVFDPVGFDAVLASNPVGLSLMP